MDLFRRGVDNSFDVILGQVVHRLPQVSLKLSRLHFCDPFPHWHWYVVFHWVGKAFCPGDADHQHHQCCLQDIFHSQTFVQILDGLTCQGPTDGETAIVVTASAQDECLSHHSFLRLAKPFHTFGGLCHVHPHILHDPRMPGLPGLHFKYLFV